MDALDQVRVCQTHVQIWRLLERGLRMNACGTRTASVQIQWLLCVAEPPHLWDTWLGLAQSSCGAEPNAHVEFRNDLAILTGRVHLRPSEEKSASLIDITPGFCMSWHSTLCKLTPAKQIPEVELPWPPRHAKGPFHVGVHLKCLQ